MAEGSPEAESWRGCSMKEIYRNNGEFELDHVEPVRVSESHTVLYHCPIHNISDNSPPRPLKANSKWDAMHVRLPCAVESKYPVTKPDATSAIESRWEMINHFLQKPITNSQELQEAIFAYNTRYKDQWDFVALHTLFEEMLDESERRVFFEDLLPRIIRLALKLPELIKAPIPLLKQGHSHSVTLSQQQISCLLANAFLCTFPRRNTLKRKSEYSTFPDINFNRLFQSNGPAVMEKIKCICHYFRRVCPTERDSANVPSGVVTFTRRSLEQSDLPDWVACDAQIGATPLHIASHGTIEDQGQGLLQVDFANKFLGGGVLGGGCVQEEIRFVICPELLISKLFTECLRPTEALLMVGCERYSNYSGYASTFKWAGDHEDVIPRDSSRRRMTHIVAIDALAFREKQHQYREDLMLRELNKAYTGFLHELESPAPGVASGNWGCGAFRGEARLKALLQLMVCTVTKRPLVYFTFGDSELRDDIHKMHTFFLENNIRVCDLWDVLRKFEGKTMPLYEFIHKNLGKSKFGLKLSKLIPNFFPPQSSKLFHSAASNPEAVASVNTTTDQVKEAVGSANKDMSASDGETGSSPDTSITDSKCLCPKETADIRITISEESESDEIILTAGSSIATSPEGNTESDISKTPAKQGTTRQRTLLEMLDQCYTEGPTSPAMKRHCAPNPPNQS